MASNDKPGRDDEALEGSWSPRRRPSSTRASTSGTPGAPADPEQLVDDIERTREDLAETLDAIADKVSPKRVVARTKEQARSDAHDAVEIVKERAAAAAASVKESASSAAEAVKDGVAQAKERVRGDDDPVRSPLGPATSVEVGSATPVTAGPPAGGSPSGGLPPTPPSPLPSDTVSLAAPDVPLEPAATPRALAGAAVVRVEPAGAESPSTSALLPASSSSKAPLLAGAGAALLVVLLLLKRRRR